MKDVVIVGAGGFGREVTWLIEDNNSENQEWNILGYISNEDQPYLKYPVLGDDNWILNYDKELNVVCCIGNADLREKIITKYQQNKNIKFPSIISRHAIVGSNVRIGNGVIICAGTILTVNVKVSDFSIINLDCTLGHEAVLGEFVTVYPSVNISGGVTIGNNCELGTGSTIIQGISIGNHTIIGSSSAVVRDIPSWSTAVGVPSKVIKTREEKKVDNSL